MVSIPLYGLVRYPLKKADKGKTKMNTGKAIDTMHEIEKDVSEYLSVNNLEIVADKCSFYREETILEPIELNLGFKLSLIYAYENPHITSGVCGYVLRNQYRSCRIRKK